MQKMQKDKKNRHSVQASAKPTQPQESKPPPSTLSEIFSLMILVVLSLECTHLDPQAPLSDSKASSVSETSNPPVSPGLPSKPRTWKDIEEEEEMLAAEVIYRSFCVRSCVF
jgi:hypothetical protein